jgi:hypothetical protein
MVHSIPLAVAIALASSIPALATPDDSYRESCRQIQQDGPMLTALCRDRDGGWASTSLDLRTCQGGGVSNRNGRLMCAGGRGEKEY